MKTKRNKKQKKRKIINVTAKLFLSLGRSSRDRSSPKTVIKLFPDNYFITMITDEQKICATSEYLPKIKVFDPFAKMICVESGSSRKIVVQIE